MIDLKTIFLGVVVIFGFFPEESLSQGSMCGVATPDPMKHCVTLRLPWQMEPMHFCIEKDKFRFRNKCNGNNNMMCRGMENMRNDTLILATPWECCPYNSVPDHCMTQNCPPPPLNRKCVILDDNMMGMNNMRNMYNSYDCCPKYYCEENVTPENCRMKRLEPACVSPPQGKMGCVAFIDSFGCCTKYQCDGEGKPGMCPMQHQAVQMVMRFNSSMSTQMNMMANMVKPPEQPPAAASVKGNREDVEIIQNNQNQNSHGVSPFERINYPNMNMNNNNMNMNNMMECIGDAFCPGTMKCCSNDMSAYGDNRYMMRNMNPTYGHCMEPMMMASIQKS